MLDSEIIFRCKTMEDEELNDFLAKEEVIERLLEYAFHRKTSEYCPIKVDKLILEDKYPYTAGKMLTSTISKKILMNKIVNSPKLTKILFSILQEKKPNNFYGTQFVTVMSHFVRNDNVRGTLFKYIYGESNLLGLFLSHIHTIPTMDTLVMSCLNYEEGDEAFEVRREEFVKEVINSISSLDQTQFVSKLLCNLLQNERPNTCADLIFKYIELLVDNVLKIHESDYEFAEACKVFNTIMLIPPEEDLPLLNFLQKLEKFVEVLNSDFNEKLEPIVTNHGDVKPLGLSKMAIVEVFHHLFEKFEDLVNVHQDVNIKKYIIESKVFETLLDLFFKYNNNNILHSLVSTFIVNLLKKKIFVLTDVIFKSETFVKGSIKIFQEHKRLLVENKDGIQTIPYLRSMFFALDNLDPEKKNKYVPQNNPDIEIINEDLRKVFFFQSIYRCGGNIAIPTEYRNEITKLSEPDSEKCQKFWESDKNKKDQHVDDYSFFLTE